MLKAQQKLIDSTVNMTLGNHSVKHRDAYISEYYYHAICVCKVDRANRIVHFDNGGYSTSSTTRTINGYKKYFVDYLGYEET